MSVATVGYAKIVFRWYCAFSNVVAFTNATDCGIPISKLASGEKTDIPAVPHVGMPVGSSLQSCDYKLKLKYEFRLPFYKTIMEKHYYVELRNSGEEFTWQVSLR